LEWLPSRTKKTTIVGKDVEKKEPSCTVGGDVRKTVWKLHKKLKIDLLYDPIIPFLRIFLKKCKSNYNKVTCTHIFFIL
jgi:hypothetical protein